MRTLMMGAAALVALIGPEAVAQSTIPKQTVGIWTFSSVTSDACMISAAQGGLTLDLSADLSMPGVFILDLVGSWAVNAVSNVAVSFDGASPQSLTGTVLDHRTLRVKLGNGPQNNFAAFLHGFTASANMSVAVGASTVDYSLVGTTAVVGILGQCTIADNFSNLPYPWHTTANQIVPSPALGSVAAPSAPPVTPSVSLQAWGRISTNIVAAQMCGFLTLEQMSAAPSYEESFYFSGNVPDAYLALMFGPATDAAKEAALQPGWCENYPPYLLNAIRMTATDAENGTTN